MVNQQVYSDCVRLEHLGNFAKQFENNNQSFFIFAHLRASVCLTEQNNVTPTGKILREILF